MPISKSASARVLDVRAGTPSHDRFNAILSMLSWAEFERCLLSSIEALKGATVTIAAPGCQTDRPSHCQQPIQNRAHAA